MNHPTEENLLGYVLGALDAQEQHDVQAAIDANPQLEERLLQIKNALVPLDYIETAGPRPGLARRTCEMVASNHFDVADEGLRSSAVMRSSDANNAYTSQAKSHSNVSPTTHHNIPSPRHLLSPSTWSLPDFAVAVGLMAVVAGILFPAVSYTRYNSRLTCCQNNLRELGSAFFQYSDANNGWFVDCPRSGPMAVSGSFAPILMDGGYVTDQSLFACAGAAAECATAAPVRIPSIASINAATGTYLIHLQQKMGGDYGCALGYCTTEGYCPPQNSGRTNVVLLADTPSLKCSGRISPNHGGRGQNCLFEDGHVKYVAGDSLGEDAIFVNDCNLVAPGCRPCDNVIAPSHLSPMR